MQADEIPGKSQTSVGSSANSAQKLEKNIVLSGEFLTAPPKHEENLFMLSFTLDCNRNMNDKSKHRRDNLHKLADRRDWSFLATHMDVKHE